MAVLVLLDPRARNHFPFNHILRIGNVPLRNRKASAQLHRLSPERACNGQFIVPKGGCGRLKAGTDFNGRVHANADGYGQGLSQFFRPFRHGAYMPRPRGKENGQFILSLYAEAVDGHITGPCVGMAGITHSQGDIWPRVIRRIGGRGHQPGQIESRFFCQMHHFLTGCLFL